MTLTRNIYDVNWHKLVSWLTIPMCRKPKMLLWVKALASPVVHCYNAFLIFKASVNYRMLITPQVCHLERALNDRYDFALRRITIVDGIEFNATPIFLREELKPIKLFNKNELNMAPVLYLKPETGNFTADFIIKVPATIAFDMVELRAFTDTYKLLSKKYIVQTV